MEPTKDIIRNDSPDHRRLTPERVRREKGLEHLSDEQAEKLIRTLELITIMHVEVFLKEHKMNSSKTKEAKHKK